MRPNLQVSIDVAGLPLGIYVCPIFRWMKCWSVLLQLQFLVWDSLHSGVKYSLHSMMNLRAFTNIITFTYAMTWCNISVFYLMLLWAPLSVQSTWLLASITTHFSTVVMGVLPVYVVNSASAMSVKSCSFTWHHWKEETGTTFEKVSIIKKHPTKLCIWWIMEMCLPLKDN